MKKGDSCCDDSCCNYLHIGIVAFVGLIVGYFICSSFGSGDYGMLEARIADCEARAGSINTNLNSKIYTLESSLGSLEGEVEAVQKNCDSGSINAKMLGFENNLAKIDLLNEKLAGLETRLIVVEKELADAGSVVYAEPKPDETPIVDETPTVDDTPIEDQTITCCFGFECYEVETIDECRDAGGAISMCIPVKGVAVEKPPVDANVSDNVTNASSQFALNVSNATARSNISGRTYVPNTYDCDDFASDLERNLTARGYDSTFTVMWCYNAAGATTKAHAVTDVHAADGSILFVEPQTGNFENLDRNGDGRVGYRTHHSEARRDTEGNCEIEVYPDRAAAVAAGVRLD